MNVCNVNVNVQDLDCRLQIVDFTLYPSDTLDIVQNPAPVPVVALALGVDENCRCVNNMQFCVQSLECRSRRASELVRERARKREAKQRKRAKSGVSAAWVQKVRFTSLFAKESDQILNRVQENENQNQTVPEQALRYSILLYCIIFLYSHTHTQFETGKLYTVYYILYTCVHDTNTNTNTSTLILHCIKNHPHITKYREESSKLQTPNRSCIVYTLTITINSLSLIHYHYQYQLSPFTSFFIINQPLVKITKILSIHQFYSYIFLTKKPTKKQYTENKSHKCTVYKKIVKY